MSCLPSATSFADFLRFVQTERYLTKNVIQLRIKLELFSITIEFKLSGFQTDRQTDRQTDNLYLSTVS